MLGVGGLGGSISQHLCHYQKCYTHTRYFFQHWSTAMKCFPFPNPGSLNVCGGHNCYIMTASRTQYFDHFFIYLLSQIFDCQRVK